MATPTLAPTASPSAIEGGDASAVKAKRAVCAICLRAQSTCICALAVRTPHTTDILILQHPMEVHHAKNTARLLHLSLPGSRLVVGEAFDDAQLHALVPTCNYAVLLYPPTPAHSDNERKAQHCLPAQLDATRLPPTSSASHITLVVLDATWRKSRKMLHTSPALQRLPRLALHDLPRSAYAIRKAHAPGQLSTLEATCAALAQLEGDAAKFNPVLHAFSRFVAQQMARRPDSTGKLFHDATPHIP
jgi:DTW domain-containing protein YfiP